MTIGAKTRAYLSTTDETLVFTFLEAGTVNIRYSNLSAGMNGVTSSISPGAASTAGLADRIAPNQDIAYKGILEDLGIIVSAGEKLFVKARVPGIAIRVMGA